MVSFKPRKDFAALRLHDKNAYLQEVANAFQQEAGEEPVLLSKVALSRLRRFYSRRSFADLKLEEMGDGLMRDTLIRMAEAIHGKELKKVLSSEMPATREEAASVGWVLLLRWSGFRDNITKSDPQYSGRNRHTRNPTHAAQ